VTRGADSGRPGVRRHNAGVVVRTRIRLAALVALVGITAACSGESHFTAPNAFCDAAHAYEKEIEHEQATTGKADRVKQLRLMRKVAAVAPKKIAPDVRTFVDALERVPHDRSVVDNPKVKRAVDNVNRYFSQGCGVFSSQNP